MSHTHSRNHSRHGGDSETELSEREIAELELELKRVRSEADASRWEARAAELELLLQRAGAREISNWDALAAAAARRQSASNPQPPNPQPPTSTTPTSTTPRAATVPPPQRPQPEPAPASAKPARKKSAAEPLAQKFPQPALPATSQRVPPGSRPAALAVKSGGDNPDVKRKTRKRPAGWLVSLSVHVALLLILAALTLSVHTPRDQVALQASAASVTETESLQMIELQSMSETSEAQRSPAREAPSEIDPLGELALSPAVPPSVPPAELTSSLPQALADAFDSTQMLSALTADTQAATRFCGVEGGGNHFVYVVDSSQSMKNGRFESARAELLQSIDALTSEQRFYIIFYDTHVERMCIAHPNEPEEHSVMATDENKRAARRWAMRVTLERGAPPDEALEFALKLRPDVIFLLSDGEFPQRIEDLMAERNRVSNLFGEDRPISILHTIGYHSRDGETRMRRLATANGGEYHYIAAP